MTDTIFILDSILYRNNIPVELCQLIKSYIPIPVTDQNIRSAVNLWFINREECVKTFGHISFWDTSVCRGMIIHL